MHGRWAEKPKKKKQKRACSMLHVKIAAAQLKIDSLPLSLLPGREASKAAL